MSDVENAPSASRAAADSSDQQQTGAGAASAAAATQQQKPSFKIVGRVVMAMRRFQASLNPTYSYGKRHSDSAVEHTDGHRVMVQPHAAGAAASGRTASGRTASGRTMSGRPTSAGQQHGFKANLLFRPLPQPEPADTAVKSG